MLELAAAPPRVEGYGPGAGAVVGASSQRRLDRILAEPCELIRFGHGVDQRRGSGKRVEVEPGPPRIIEEGPQDAGTPFRMTHGLGGPEHQRAADQRIRVASEGVCQIGRLNPHHTINVGQGLRRDEIEMGCSFGSRNAQPLLGRRIDHQRREQRGVGVLENRCQVGDLGKLQQAVMCRCNLSPTEGPRCPAGRQCVQQVEQCSIFQAFLAGKLARQRRGRDISRRRRAVAGQYQHLAPQMRREILLARRGGPHRAAAGVIPPDSDVVTGRQRSDQRIGGGRPRPQQKISQLFELARAVEPFGPDGRELNRRGPSGSRRCRQQTPPEPKQGRRPWRQLEPHHELLSGSEVEPGPQIHRQPRAVIGHDGGQFASLHRSEQRRHRNLRSRL